MAVEVAMLVQDMEKALVAILSKYDIARIAIFGSWARGEAGADSDLDVLAEFKKTKSLLTLVRIERELSEALGIKVDLLTEKCISPRLMERIRGDLRIIHQ